MAPTDNVWFNASGIGLRVALDAVSAHLRKHGTDYGQRALVLPRKDALGEDYLQAYIANGNVGSPRGKRAKPGGPVLAIDATLKVLDMGFGLADGNLFGIATAHPDDITGWAAATKALNLKTGERHPGVPLEIATALQDLHDDGYNGYGRTHERHFSGSVDTLRAAGYDFDFVASYLVALGKSADSVEHLKTIYKGARKQPSRPR